MARATFAAGCFWGVEAEFRCVPGITSTAVGYMGGTTPDPRLIATSAAVAPATPESVDIEYDPNAITYERLLEVFWQSHDPTTLNRQGADIGTQYRSVIFYHTPEQEAAARASKAAQQKVAAGPIVTEIVAATTFYRAEEYHQQYYEKRGHSICKAP
jgi:peptide-methionine (S)-S-oxide reductase